MVPSPREVFTRPPALPGTLEMKGQDLGIGPACTLESQGDVSMAIRQGGLGEACNSDVSRRGGAGVKDAARRGAG